MERVEAGCSVSVSGAGRRQPGGAGSGSGSRLLGFGSGMDWASPGFGLLSWAPIFDHFLFIFLFF